MRGGEQRPLFQKQEKAHFPLGVTRNFCPGMKMFSGNIKRGCCKTEVEQQPPLFVKSRIGRDFFKNFRRNSLQIILSRRSKAELSAMRKPGFLCFFRCHKYLLFFERKKMCFPSVLSQFGAVLVQIKGQTQQKQFQRDVGFPSHKEAFELAVAF